MRLVLTYVGLLALLCSGFTSEVAAAGGQANADCMHPWVELQASPAAPERLPNPGGTFEARCWIHGNSSERSWLEISIYDPDDQRIFHDTRPQSEYCDVQWTVPGGTPDGLYRYVIELMTSDGPLSASEGDIILGGLTSGLCSYKFIDANGNGIYEPAIDALATGWEICVIGKGCKVTASSYTVCWFFLPVGEYTICETQQPGYTPTTLPCYTVSVLPREIAKVSFGNRVVIPTGACCLHDGSCTVVTQAECQAAGGIYQGNGTSCTPNPCPQPTGACCYHDGHCAVTTQAECAASGGIWQGMDTSCSPNPCNQPGGACCYMDGHCAVTTETECAASGGIWQGMDTSCSPNPCPQPSGACCFPDGHCAVVTSAACSSAGGTYYGDFTDCNPNPCTQPVGACCFADGHCDIATAAECAAAGGIYQGTGTDCEPNPCPQPTGACCYPDGHCAVTTAVECAESGGLYHGAGTVCDPNPCSQPTGACCLSDGSCMQITEAECEAQGGMYLGTGIVCGPTSCPPTAVENKTWGGVKHLYR